VQPDVHRRRVVHVAAVVQLARQRLAVLQAAVEAEQLHQVDDRRAPVQLLRVLLCHAVEHRLDVDFLHRRRG